MGGGQSIASAIAIPVIYSSWLGLRFWSPRASMYLLLIVNFATAAAVAIYDLIPIDDVLEDWRLQAIVAFELVAAAAAVAAFLRYRPALYFSYLVFAVHLFVILWAETHPFNAGQLPVLNYG